MGHPLTPSLASAPAAAAATYTLSDAPTSTWTADEMAFVASLLSDAADEPSSLDGDASSDAEQKGDNQSRESAAPPPAAAATESQGDGSSQGRKSARSQLTAEEKKAARRQSHRETMRRSRQRFRDQIASMVRTVEHLEAERARALAQRPQASVALDLQRQVEYLETQRQQLLSENNVLHAQVVESLLAITHAYPGCFQHDRVCEHVSGQTRFASSQSNVSDADFYVMPCTATSAAANQDSLTLCDFVTWDVSTVGHCLQLVQNTARDIAEFYAATVAASSSTQPSYQAEDDLMGWTAQHRAVVNDGTCVQFAFLKTFAEFPSAQLFQKTWAFCRHQRQFAALLEPVVNALQLEVLHVINNDLVVVRAMHEQPSGQEDATKYRSIYLLYQMASPAGLFVVLRSVNPNFTRSCGCTSNAWVESFLWFGFSTLSTNASGCNVRFGGWLDGPTRDFARYWQREIFFLLLRWESLNVAPVLRVHPQ